MCTDLLNHDHLTNHFNLIFKFQQALDPVYKLGSHWILLYNSENSVYFDSLGNPPVNDLVNLIPSMNKPI